MNLDRRLRHRHSAVHVNGLAGDVTCLFGSKVDAGRADIVAAAHCTHWDAREDARTLLLVERIGHRRRHETGGDSVDGDVAAVTSAVPVTTIQCSERWWCFCSDSLPPGLTIIRFVWNRSPRSMVWYVPHGR